MNKGDFLRKNKKIVVNRNINLTWSIVNYLAILLGFHRF